MKKIHDERLEHYATSDTYKFMIIPVQDMAGELRQLRKQKKLLVKDTERLAKAVMDYETNTGFIPSEYEEYLEMHKELMKTMEEK